MSHPLLKNAFCYTYKDEIEEPNGFFFDDTKGLWSNGDNFLVDLPERKRLSMGTKKADRETGEDQKGT